VQADGKALLVERSGSQETEPAVSPSGCEATRLHQPKGWFFVPHTGIQNHSTEGGIMTPLLILLLGLASVPQGDTDELPHYWLPEMVVTAKRIREPLHDVAVDMKILTEEEISQRGIRTLSQLFIEEGILDTRVTGIEGGLVTVGLRGFPADHVLVMVNGTVVNSPANGTFDFSEIPLSSIRSIEIVKGPASSYYGAYASSGVINIITEEQTEEGLNLEVEGNVSQDAAYHAYTGAGFRRDMLSGQLFVSRRKNDGERKNSDFAATSGSGFLSYGSFARLSLSLGKREVGAPGPVPAPDYLPAFGDSEVSSLFDGQKNDHASGCVQFEKSFRDFTLLSTISYRKDHLIYEQVYENFRPDWSTYRASDNWYYGTETITGSVQVTFHWLTVGLEAQNQEFWADDTLIDSDNDSLVSTLAWNPYRKNKGIWGSVRVPLLASRFIPSASVRWDKNSDYNDFVSSSISAMLKPLSFISIGTSIAEGVRPPTFNELYWPVYGNRELKPQESLQLNGFVDVSYREKLFIRISGFKREVKEAISWVNFTPKNIDRLTSKGIELNPEFRPIDFLSFSLTAVFMKTDEERTSADPSNYWIIGGKTVSKRRASYVPETKIQGSLTVKPVETTSLMLSAVHTGDRIAYFYDYATFAYGIKRIEPNTIFNACVQQELLGSLHLLLRVDNILDKEYHSNFGYSLTDGDYPAPGRVISLGVRYAL
jgi:vitamin B12 transporter